MMRHLQHRGPDQRGVHCSPEIAVGHHRLSIIDLDGGKQPMTNLEGDTLVFNGEIYNFQALAQRAQAEGIQVEQRSDTAVLFKLLCHLPVPDVLERLEGMFAFAFYQAKSGALFLVRDRAGEKPLYYLEQGHGLYFASEIGSLTTLTNGAPHTLSIAQCQLFLALEYLPGANTAYTHIQSLLPGHFYVKTSQSGRLVRYWPGNTSKQSISPTPVSFSQTNKAVDKLTTLDNLLRASVREQLYADVPVGVFLSGGIDSSLIAAYSRSMNDNIQAFTVTLPYESYDESAYAKLAAKHLDIPLHTIELNDDDLYWAMDTLDEKLDEPFADYSLLPTLLLCRAARSHVKVALGGDGADELFAGYPNFNVQRFAPLMQRIPPLLGSLLRNVLRPFLKSTGYMNAPFKLQQLSYGFGQPTCTQSFHWMSALSAKEINTASARPFNMNSMLTSVYDEFQLEYKGAFTVENLADILFRTYLPADILTKIDRASMYNSLEVRAPYLSRAVIDYVHSLPFDEKLRNGKPKFLLKEVARQYLPIDIIERRKHGFAMPLAELMRNQFRDRFQQVIEDKSNCAYEWLDYAYVNKLWQLHLANNANNAKKLWVLYRLLILSKKFSRGIFQ